MNKCKLTIDTESINMENEIHVNNFSQKVKNLALHCVNYLNGIEDSTDCSNNRFLPEIHDNDCEQTFEYNAFPSFPSFNKRKFDTNFIIYEPGISNLLHI